MRAIVGLAIRGKVDSRRQARIEVEVRGSGGSFQTIETVVDTGFTGHLTLPAETIGRLGLRRGLRTTVTLGTGIRERVNTYRGDILWHGQTYPILILESRGTPLLGMELLEGSLLTIQAKTNGDVLIEKLDDRA